MTDANNTLSDSTEIEVASDNGIAAAIAGLQSGNDADIWTTFTGEDFETRLSIFDAVSNSTPVAEKINTPITLANIIVQRVELTNEQTGEVQSQPRITFVDKDGNAYNVTSPVVLRDVRTLFALAGKPHEWPDSGVTVKFVRGGTGTRQFFTMKPVLGKK